MEQKRAHQMSTEQQELSHHITLPMGIRSAQWQITSSASAAPGLPEPERLTLSAVLTADHATVVRLTQDAGPAPHKRGLFFPKAAVEDWFPPALLELMVEANDEAFKLKAQGYNSQPFLRGDRSWQPGYWIALDEETIFVTLSAGDRLPR